MSKTFKRVMTLLLALVTVLSLLPLASPQAASLKQGSKGTEVKQLQKNLIGLGFLEGSADGSYGSKTKAAVKEFQAEFGLSPDGNAGEATQAAVSNAVVRLQVELKNAGFAPGTPDGHFGSKTKTALKKFQKDRMLPETGVADTATWKAINKSSTGLQAGSGAKTAAQIKQLQQALIGLGFLTGKADGVYGSKTREAVRSFQKAYGLGVDGSAGPDTITALKNAVVAIQNALARKGYYSGHVDSSFGGGTKSAVKAYQRAVKLSETGVAGASTVKKLLGYSLGGSDGASDAVAEDRYKTWIDPLYQDTDFSKFYYNNRTKWKTVKTSGCAGVSMAMALNALLDTSKHTGQSVMQWYADHGYYLGNGTYHSGVLKYPRTLGLNSTYCSKKSEVASHLKKDRLAVVLIKDKTGDEFFTYHESSGHYILLSGYRVKDGEEQVYVNNPLSWKESKWFDLDDVMANAIIRREFEPFVIIYK